MDHATAISTLRDLLPQINAGAAPEEVLTKYATENNLSPAVLERLGQLFNTAKTVSFLKEASVRGDSFSTCDVEGMVEKYMQLDKAPKPLSKSAGIKANVAHDPFDIPNFYKGETGIKKEAGAYQPTEMELRLEDRIQKEAAKEAAAANRVFLQELEIYKSALYNEVIEGMDKLARFIYENGPETYAMLERDSLSSVNGNANALGNIASLMDSRYRGAYNRFDMTKAASIKVTSDTTGMRDTLDKLEETIVMYDGARDLLKEASTVGDDNGLSLLLQSGLVGAPTKESFGQSGASATGNTSTGFAEESEEEEIGDEFEAGPWSPADIDVQESNARINSAVPSGNPKAKGKGKGQEDKKDEKQQAGAKGQPASGAGFKTPQFDNVVKNVDEASTARIKGLLDKWFAKPTIDSRRVNRDAARNDIGRTNVLRQAITSDPILSTADPKRLVSLYNTLYSSNPEMMSDPNLLAYMLREAIQYDGVAPHTYEQLAKTHLTQLDGRDKQQKLNKDRYTIQ